MNLWYVYRPLDSRRLNLYTTHSVLVSPLVLSEWHCKVHNHRLPGVQKNPSFLEMQNMQMLIFKEWEYWSSDIMGNCSHVIIRAQLAQCISSQACLCCLDSNCSHNFCLSDYANQSILLFVLVMLLRALLPIFNEIL